MRRIISTTIVLALILGPIQTAAADEEPVRSGTILSGDGWFFEQQLGGCQMAPDCAAWLQSRCDPALSGRDPGLMASIEDVRDLADGRTRWVFEFKPGCCFVGGYAVVQFWQPDCTELRRNRWRSTGCDRDVNGKLCWSTTLSIPTSAQWMTVTGVPDNLSLTWTLTRAPGA